MRLALLERNAEYLLSILLIGLAIFLFREVWVSVQVLESIYKHLLEGAVFTEGPPILGVEQYLLFCLCSAGWFLLVFAFLLSRRCYPLWIVQFSFFLTPMWVVFYAFSLSSAPVSAFMESFLGHPLHCGSSIWCQALPINEKRGNLTTGRWMRRIRAEDYLQILRK